MIARKLITAKEIEVLRQRMQASMKKVVAVLTEADPDGKRGKKRIRPELWPSADFRDVCRRGDLSELAGGRTEEQVAVKGAQKSVVEAKRVSVGVARGGRRILRIKHSIATTNAKVDEKYAR